MGQLNKHNSGTKESMVFSCIVLEALFQCLKALESPVHGLMPAAKGGHGPLVLTVNAIVRSPAIFIPLVASISHDLFKWLKHLLQLVSEDTYIRGCRWKGTTYPNNISSLNAYRYFIAHASCIELVREPSLVVSFGVLFHLVVDTKVRTIHSHKAMIMDVPIKPVCPYNLSECDPISQLVGQKELEITQFKSNIDRTV